MLNERWNDNDSPSLAWSPECFVMPLFYVGFMVWLLVTTCSPGVKIVLFLMLRKILDHLCIEVDYSHYNRTNLAMRKISSNSLSQCSFP